MTTKNVDLNKLHAVGAIAEEAEGKWGMVIDMDLCTGCQACVAACAMENNIAYVGEEDAGYGRSMHWIRVERFWEGEYPNIKMTHYQPVMCQQCGHAPCEPVCPAFATVHSQAEQVQSLPSLTRSEKAVFLTLTAPSSTIVISLSHRISNVIGSNASISCRGVSSKCRRTSMRGGSITGRI